MFWLRKSPFLELVVRNLSVWVAFLSIDFTILQELEKQRDTHTPAVLDSEDYLFMLYTSGSTGKPKGIVHTQAGYLLYANMTMKVSLDWGKQPLQLCSPTQIPLQTV